VPQERGADPAPPVVRVHLEVQGRPVPVLQVRQPQVVQARDAARRGAGNEPGLPGFARVRELDPQDTHRLRRVGRIIGGAHRARHLAAGQGESLVSRVKSHDLHGASQPDRPLATRVVFRPPARRAAPRQERNRAETPRFVPADMLLIAMLFELLLLSGRGGGL